MDKKSVVTELENWIKGFKEVSSYHSGDYQEGMDRVLEGLETQLNYFRNIEQNG